MKRLLVFVLIILSIAALSCVRGGLCYPPEKPDRAKDGLVGPVSHVCYETAPLSQKLGSWVEGERKLSQVIAYNEDGNRTQWINCDYGLPYSKYLYKYDADGHLRDSYHYDGRGRLDSREICVYEAACDRSQMCCYDSRSELDCRRICTYDESRKQRRVSTCGKGWRSRFLETLDSKGNVLERVIYDTDGAIQSRDVIPTMLTKSL